MTPEAVLAWARKHHPVRPGAAWRALAAGVRTLAAGRGRGRLVTDHFQACLNTRDLWSVVKLVHVAENAHPGDEAAGWGLVPARRRALKAFLAGLNEAAGASFDAAVLERVWDAAAAAGAGGWYPIVGFEFHPATGGFPEVSFYAEHRAQASAEAAARALAPAALARVAARRVFALGLDLLADGRWRLKFYFDAPAAEAAGLLAQLDRRLTPARALTLLRTRPEGGFEESRKAYVPLKTSEPGRVTALSGEEFPEAARGPLKAFARRIAPALRGQHLFYIGSSDEKTEVYFGHGEPPR